MAYTLVSTVKVNSSHAIPFTPSVSFTSTLVRRDAARHKIAVQRYSIIQHSIAVYSITNNETNTPS